jgi:hypothetical protein
MITIKNNINQYIKLNELRNLDIDIKQIFILALTGSRMYGTNTPTSDKDFIGVFIPTTKEILLNDIAHHIPYKKGNIDLQLWSIHHFLNLACKGETMAIDLLHAPYDNWLIYNHGIWTSFVNNKHEFYTKNMKSFVSYARKQAAVYGIKGSRMEELETVVKYLKTIDPDVKLATVWDDLPSGKHIFWLNESPYRMYQVCGRKFQETVKISYALGHLKKLLTNYGQRAKMAKDNKGVDWKAFSHAIRSAEQVYWILKYGQYSYPLKNQKFIKMVKLGEIEFEMAQAVLEDYMTEIERLIEKSTLPETVDRKRWDQWLINLLQYGLKC